MDVSWVPIGLSKTHILLLTFILKNAVVKLQQDQHTTLTPDEMEVAKHLLREDLDDDNC
jgi:hypothetical protein